MVKNIYSIVSRAAQCSKFPAFLRIKKYVNVYDKIGTLPILSRYLPTGDSSKLDHNKSSYFNQVNDQELKVKCMEYSSEGTNCFRWPSKDDIITYPIEDILCKIQPPEPINSRRFFALSDDDFKHAVECFKEHGER